MPNVRASATSAIMVYSVDAVPVSEHSLKHKTPERIVLRKPKQFLVHADVLSVRSSETRMAPQRHPSDIAWLCSVNTAKRLTLLPAAFATAVAAAVATVVSAALAVVTALC